MIPSLSSQKITAILPIARTLKALNSRFDTKPLRPRAIELDILSDRSQ
ncbi:MAG: hypothetical protein ACMG55_08290 [Microcoleus sp.]